MAGNTNQDKVEKFINTLAVARHGAMRLEVVHGGTKGGPPIQIYHLDPSEGLDGAALSKEIVALSKNDAETHGGPQTYLLKVYREDDDSRPSFQTGFKVDGGEAGPAPDGASHQVIAMMAKHVEGLVRTIQLMTADTNERLIKVIDAREKRIGELEDKVTSFLSLQEEMMQENHKRALDLKKEEAAEKRKDAAFSKFMMLLPAIVNKWAGKPVLPDNSSAGAMKQFLESLEESQMLSIMSQLKPEQVTLLESLIGKTEEETKES